MMRGRAKRWSVISAMAVLAVLAIVSGCSNELMDVEVDESEPETQEEPETYTVSFDRQGGSGGSTSVTVVLGQPMPEAVAPSRSGYVFGGYYSGIAGGGTQYYTAEMESAHDWDIRSDAELVAFWADAVSPYVGAMRYVPGGTFQRDGGPTNTTTVSGFYMSAYPITQAQYVAVTGKANPSSFDSGADAPNRPVELVSWYDALVFSNMLSMAEGKTPVYTIDGSTDPDDWGPVPTSSDATWDAVTMNLAADGYRLPTEAEWMWAAMGATSGHDYPGSGVYTTGYLKSFAGSTGSNSIDDYAWYSGNAGGTTHPVGTKLPNELGIYDMSGNVFEWTWDWAANYPSGPLTDATGPSSGTARVLRGGSWSFVASSCTVAYRISDNPRDRFSSVGFRVVSR